tara:strand:- start:160 stop:1347 length:1188 start_codon:yes stop_codon:yes gene_type:complete
MAITFIPANSFPQNSEDGFPVGQSFYLAFSNSVDLKTLKTSCILFGKDFDRSSGPDNALWVNNSDSTNPFFLKSPGHKGFVECDFEEYFVDDFTDDEPAAIQYLLEQVAEKKTIVRVTPKQVLAENTEYKLFIVGKTSEDVAVGVPDYVLALSKQDSARERSVYDAQDSTSAFEERIITSGSYIKKGNENSATLNIKVITEGIGSKAEYIWWFSDEAEPGPAAPEYKKRKSRAVQRWRNTDRGVLIKFSAALLELNETFQVKCYDSAKLENSYLITFQTSTDSIYTYPDHASTSPIGLGANIIPGLDGVVEENKELKVVSIEPYDGSINNRLDLNKIIITFNEDLDPASITQEAIKITSYPVSGSFDRVDYSGLNQPQKLYKIISVSNNKIIVEI